MDNFSISPLTVQVDCSSVESVGSYNLPFSVILPNGITLNKVEPTEAKINVVDSVHDEESESNLDNSTESTDLSQATEVVVEKTE